MNTKLNRAMELAAVEVLRQTGVDVLEAALVAKRALRTGSRWLHTRSRWPRGWWHGTCIMSSGSMPRVMRILPGTVMPGAMRPNHGRAHECECYSCFFHMIAFSLEFEDVGRVIYF